MEFITAEFFSALFAIIVIDLMLAGDNAIVIALAARNLQKDVQKRAIIWGMAGAIVMRIAMTLLVVWLLRIPGLLFIGGVLLVWIAYRLLLPNQNEGDHGKTVTSFWGAMRTIVVADAIMGLDNVLAVAGAAHGSFVLVVLGLLISVPIVIWGSGTILRYVERFPSIVYFGAGVLAWTAVKMVIAEPLLKEFFALNDAIVPLTYGVVVVGVLWFGFIKNHGHLESRISANLARLAAQRQSFGSINGFNEGEKTMEKILLPVDGSPNSLYAVQQVVREFFKNSNMEIHLLNVRHPFSKNVARFVSKKNRDSFYREEAEKALKPCREVLEQYGIPFSQHVEKGDRAEVIVATAKRLRCNLIVMSTARKNSLTRMLEASVTNRVLELTTVPVEVVSGDAVSGFERFGIPAGIGAAITALLMIALD